MVAGVEEKFRPVPIVVEPKVMPFVMPADIAPELVILRASVTTVDPAVLVSALSRSRSEATALSVVFAVVWFWILRAVSVLPATDGLLVKLTLRPVKLVLALVDWALVISKRSAVIAVFAVAVLVEVTDKALPVVSEAAAIEAAVPVVAVDDMVIPPKVGVDVVAIS